MTFSNVNNDLSTPPCVFEMKKKKKEEENISANSKQQVECRFDRFIIYIHIYVKQGFDYDRFDRNDNS